MSIAVSDGEILEGMKQLALRCGIFAEPAAAAAVAGLFKAQREGIGFAGRTVVLVTGLGLKDVPSMVRATQMK